MDIEKIEDTEIDKDRPLYRCSYCGDLFDRPDLGCCPSCHHHYPAGTRCKNCYNHTLRKTMKETGLTVKQYIESRRKELE